MWLCLLALFFVSIFIASNWKGWLEWYAASEKDWNRLLLDGLTVGKGDISPEEFYAVIKKRIERTLIRTVRCSHLDTFEMLSLAALWYLYLCCRREVLTSSASWLSIWKAFSQEQRRLLKLFRDNNHDISQSNKFQFYCKTEMMHVNFVIIIIIFLASCIQQMINQVLDLLNWDLMRKLQTFCDWLIEPFAVRE